MGQIYGASQHTDVHLEQGYRQRPDKQRDLCDVCKTNDNRKIDLFALFLENNVVKRHDAFFSQYELFVLWNVNYQM